MLLDDVITSGAKFGRWTVISLDKNVYACNERAWLCRCDCGTEKIVSERNLLRGKSKSCGCLQRDMAREKAFKHGGCNERLYSVWHAI